MFVVITLVGAAAGLLSRTRPKHGIGILAATGGLAAAAVWYAELDIPRSPPPTGRCACTAWWRGNTQ